MAGFNLGDRVRVTTDLWGLNVHHKEGTVIEANEESWMLVDFGLAWEDPYEPGSTKKWFHTDYLEAAPIRPFYLVAIQDGKEVPLNEHPTFDTGKDAADYARKLSAQMGCKVQPRRVQESGDDWRERERRRLEDGTYPKLPDAWDLPPIEDHFLHLSQHDPTMLAYTESPEKGIVDRQTRISPGKYLKRFYPDLNQEEMKRYIAMVDTTMVLHFAKTADEIEWVYAKGPHSCMSGPYNPDPDELEDDEEPVKFFDSYCHPVRAYSGSDLQVAYFRKDERVTARAVVWPDKKQFVRAYGDIARLKLALELDGYTQVNSFEGARLRRLWDVNQNGYVLPYLDGSCQYVRDDGQWMVIDPDGDILANTTEGIAWEMQKCERTGARIDPEEDNAYTVIVGVDPERTETWCSDAVEQYAYEYRHRDGWYWCSELYAKDICVPLGNPDNDDWMPKHIADKECERCALTGWLFRKEQLVRLADGRKVNAEDFGAMGFVCAGNGRNYLNADGVELKGRMYSKEYVARRAAYNARRREKRRLARLEQQALAA